MNSLGFPLVSLLLWLPALGALLLLVLPVERPALHRSVALLVSGATLGLACAVVGFFVGGASTVSATSGLAPLQLVDQLAWLPSWGASYTVGVDGLNIWLVLLTTLLAPIAVLATGSQQTRLRALLALLLVAETAFLGLFLVQDMLLFYVFYEAALVPMVFLVGMWGSGNHGQAASKLFLYTFASSVLMLIGIIALNLLHRNAIGLVTPGYRGTFEIAQIATDLRTGAFALDPTAARLIFGAFFAAFAVKMALWPFHTWLPDAYASAPTPVAILLAGVMAKFGTYGFLRFNLTLFPEASQWAAPAIATLAVIGIIYAAIVAFAQSDMQRLIGYSSISHMNFIALGIFALNSPGISGAVFQMFCHGLSTAALLLVVAVVYERRQSRTINSFGGLWKVMPTYGGLALLALLATAGLPGLGNFVGEFTMMQGVASSTVLGAPFAAGAAIGVILAAAYTLRWFRISFMGEANSVLSEGLVDLSNRERVLLGLLAIALVVTGLFPNLLFAPLQSAVSGVLQYLGPTVASGG